MTILTNRLRELLPAVMDETMDGNMVASFPARLTFQALCLNNAGAIVEALESRQRLAGVIDRLTGELERLRTGGAVMTMHTRCTCPSDSERRWSDDPYYVCEFCEQQQEEAAYPPRCPVCGFADDGDCACENPS